MGTSDQPRCAICRKPAPPRSDNPAFPLCSERCRLIDLGNWLGESYRVPTSDRDHEASSDASPDEDD